MSAGSSAPAEPAAAAGEKDSFLPPHLEGVVSPQSEAPTPVQNRPPQQTPSAATAASKAAEKAMLQPQKEQGHAGHQTKAPAPVPKASGLTKQPLSMPASAAMQQGSARNVSAAKVLQAYKAAPAGTTKSHATQVNSSIHERPAGVAKQAPEAASAPAVTCHEAAQKSNRASTGAAVHTAPHPAAEDAKLATAAATKGNALASSTVVAATPVASSKGQVASSAEGSSASQKPIARPAAASRLVPPGSGAPSVSAAASALLPTTSTPVPAEAVAAATSFLNNLGNADSSPSGGSWNAPLFPRANPWHATLPLLPHMRAEVCSLGSLGSTKPATEQPGITSQAALQARPGQSRPKLPAQPPSPEMRLESLMQELSDMGHRLPNAAPAKPQQRSAAPSAAASRAAASSASSSQQQVSRSASPAGGAPLRGSAPPRQPQQSVSGVAVRSSAAIQGRAFPDADVAAADKLRTEIAELQRVIDLKVREAKRKGAAARFNSQGQRRPDQASHAAPGSTQPVVTKAKTVVFKPSEQTLRVASHVASLIGRQITQASAAVSSLSASQQEQKAVAEHNKGAEHVSKPASANPTAGKAIGAPLEADAGALQKHHNSLFDGAALAPKQPPASPASKGAKAEGTQLPGSSSPSAPTSVPLSRAAPTVSVPQVQTTQPSAAPEVKQPPLKHSAQGPQPVRSQQVPSKSAALSSHQVGTSIAKPAETHASASPPAARVQAAPMAPPQQSVKLTAVPVSAPVSTPAQPIATPASARKATVEPAAHSDRVLPRSMSQPDDSAAAAKSAAPSQLQPAMPDVASVGEKPEDKAGKPADASQSAQPDTHTRVETAGAGAGAMSAEARITSHGSVQKGIPERRKPSPQLATERGEHASSATADKASPEKQGSLSAAGHLPAFPLPVLAREDYNSASTPPSDGTPAYTMLTQTPLGTGSAWSAAAQDKVSSWPASIESQPRKSSHLPTAPDQQSVPTIARDDRSGPAIAGHRAGAAGQTPQASAQVGRTPPSRQGAARGRVMT